MTQDSGLILVIACGNPLRHDDGAGIVLARKVVGDWQAQGISTRLIETQQLTPELALAIAANNVAALFFFDARIGMPEAQIEITPLTSHLSSSSVLAHQLQPELLLYYAQSLYAARSPAWLVTIPAYDLSHGEGFSATVRQLLEQTKLEHPSTRRRK